MALEWFLARKISEPVFEVDIPAIVAPVEVTPVIFHPGIFPVESCGEIVSEPKFGTYIRGKYQVVKDIGLKSHVVVPKRLFRPIGRGDFWNVEELSLA